MPGLTALDIYEEAELIERFVRCYRSKFLAAIESLNGSQRLQSPTAAELNCLKLCVETLDMVLVNQDRISRALRRLCHGATLQAA